MDSLDYLTLLEDETTREAVMSLVVAVVASDGVIHDDELVLLQQLQPRREGPELMAWVHAQAKRPLDLDAIGRTLGTDENRWRALRFAARVAWTDRHLASEEKLMLVELAASFALPVDAVETVLTDMVGRPGREVAESRVWAALDGMTWEELEFDKRHPRSSLAAVAPDASAIGTLSMEGIEVASVFPTGIAGGFKEGDAFVNWQEIESYTRIPVFGGAVRLELRDGRNLTLVDVRARPIGAFLDRVFS